MSILPYLGYDNWDLNIWYTKGNIILYLVSDVILRMNIKVKNNMTKTDFFTFIFQTSISQ